MKSRCRQAALLAVLLFFTCQPSGRAAETREGDAPAKPVKGADTGPLADDVFMRFQEIRLAGDGCGSNYRFLLYSDGRLFMQENRPEDCPNRPAGSAFNRPFGEKAVKTLDRAALKSIKQVLADRKYAEMAPSYAPEGKVFDGSIKIMEVRLAKGVKRVVSIQSASKSLEAILQVVWARLY